MSDLAIFLTGIGLGLLIVVPVFIAYRHEMALNLRRLLGIEVDEGDNQSHERAIKPASQASSEGMGSSVNIARGVIWFGFGAGILTMVCASFLGNIFAFISGAVLVVGLLLAIAVDRAKPSS